MTTSLNFGLQFKGKSVSLTGDLTRTNVTVRSESGAWKLKTNGFALNAGGAELVDNTVQ